ncbi:MAG: type IV secretory system conjugative DNA transfer family protein [Bdellovibrionota bacterium]
MFLIIESFILKFVQFYVHLELVGVFILLPLAIACIVIQFKRSKLASKIPGVIGLILLAICAAIAFNGDKISKDITSILERIANGTSETPSASILEPIFYILVGAKEKRVVIEEIIAFGFYTYLFWLIYFFRTTLREGGVEAAFKLDISELLGEKQLQRPMRSKSNELGSGDLANRAQILEWTKPKDPRTDTALPVTNLRGSDGVVLKQGHIIWANGDRNRHILAVSKTGGGKTTKLILPILYNDVMSPNRSVIILDSKPEMWSKLAGLSKKYNPDRKILLFNPLDTERGLSWNILSKIEDDTDAKLIANTLIMATDNPSAKSDSPFFRTNALAVLNAIMIGLLHDPDEVLSMPRVHELVQSGMKGLCDWLEAHPEAIRNTRTFVELARNGSQNADTILSELSMRISQWDLKAIRATTAFDELDLEQVIKEPTLLIVELRESELEMLRPMGNVIIVEILRFLTKYAEKCPQVTLPRPVGLVIDEFASALGRLPDIHVKLNTLRSRNISIVGAIQSTAQVKANYGDDADSVLAGFTSKIFMPPLDMVDSEWASKETGQMTIRFNTSSSGSNQKLTEMFASKNDNTQEQVQQRAVLTPDEVGRPTDNINTFFVPGTPVFQGYLTPYYKIPEMRKKIEDSESIVVKLRDKPIEYIEKDPEILYGDSNEGSSSGLPDGISDISGWTDEQIQDKILDTKKKLDWSNTSGSAKKWWESFEEENSNRLHIVLRLCEELAIRNATITEFFLTYIYSNTDNIQANLYYLDYSRIKKEEESRRKEA